MYVKFQAVSDTALLVLKDLSKEVPFVKAESYRRRMGENLNRALSIYSYSRWYGWSRHQRRIFQDNFYQESSDRSVVGWFLEIPAGDGFLDRQINWVGAKKAGCITAISLRGDQDILINDEVVTVREGEAVGFSLTNIHEIKPSTGGQLWACVMTLEDPCDFVNK